MQTRGSSAFAEDDERLWIGATSMSDGCAERHVEGVGVAEELRRLRALVAAFYRLLVEHLLGEHVGGGEAAGHRALEAVMAPRGRDRRPRGIDGDLEGMELARLGQVVAREAI